jgi:GH35 family endo-1,4-beta-xylanase
LTSLSICQAAEGESPPKEGRLTIVKVTGNAGWTPDDTKPEYATDGDMDTSWDAKGPVGVPVVDLTLDLGGKQEVHEIWIAFKQPRRYTFDIRGSHTGQGGWVSAAEATSDGKAHSWMRVELSKHNKRRYYRIKSHGNDAKGKEGWFNVAEVVVIGEQLNEPKADAPPAEPHTVTIPRVEGEGPDWTGKAVLSKDALSDFGGMHGRGRKQAEATLELIDLDDEKFDRALCFKSRGKTGDTGAVAFHARSSYGIARGDMLLASFWVRCVDSQSESGAGELQVSLGEASGKWRNFMSLPVNVGQKWQHVCLFGPAKKTYDPGEVRLAINAGGWPQTIEISDVRIANLGQDVDRKALPRIERDIDYPGREPEAAWRKAAAERIEKFRKGDLKVTVLDAAGKPVPGAKVHVAMQKHAFIFGTPAGVSLMSGWERPTREELANGKTAWRQVDEEDQSRYMDILDTYFNEVVVGMHPLNWESRLRTDDQRTKRFHYWGGTMEHFEQAMEWLKAHDKRIRGHAISWTPTHGNPHSMPKLVEGVDTVEAAHKWFLDVSIPRRLKGAAGRIVEYDGINHPTMFKEMPRDTEGAREYFREHPEAIARSAAILNKCKELAPDVLFYVNEGQVLPSDKRVEPYEVFIEELIAVGAKPDGIGFMGHFTLGKMPHPQEVYEKLERFAKFGLPMKLTELDVNAPNAEQTQADYLRDVFIIAFSHPQVVGINQWGFWAPNHWKGEGAALWRKDWTPKPAGQAFMDLIRKQWWTDETLATDAAGQIDTRGFCGRYRVTVKLPDGNTVDKSVDLSRQGATVILKEDQ